MRELVCIFCGSRDITCGDGSYYCECCGTESYESDPYVEWASQPYNEPCAFCHDYYREGSTILNARYAFDMKNWAMVLHHYAMITEKESDNLEAIFMTRLATTQICYGARHKSIRNTSFDDLNKCIYSVTQKSDSLDMSKRKQLFDKMYLGILDLIREDFIADMVRDPNTNEVIESQDLQDFLYHVSKAVGMFAAAMTKVVEKLPEHEKIPNVEWFYSRAIQAFKALEDNFGFGEEDLRRFASDLHYEWKGIDPSHVIPYEYVNHAKEIPNTNSSNQSEINRDRVQRSAPANAPKDTPTNTPDSASNGASGSSSGGCYVATCVYGSYDCPQVWTLRRFRDDTLGSTWFGRLFIRTYYATSPTLVKWFGKTRWFKRMFRGALDRLVFGLNTRGVSDTPYQDRQW